MPTGFIFPFVPSLYDGSRNSYILTRFSQLGNCLTEGSATRLPCTKLTGRMTRPKMARLTGGGNSHEESACGDCIYPCPGCGPTFVVSTNEYCSQHHSPGAGMGRRAEGRRCGERRAVAGR